jgi:hypothetical protein
MKRTRQKQIPRRRCSESCRSPSAPEPTVPTATRDRRIGAWATPARRRAKLRPRALPAEPIHPAAASEAGIDRRATADSATAVRTAGDCKEGDPGCPEAGTPAIEERFGALEAHGHDRAKRQRTWLGLVFGGNGRGSDVNWPAIGRELAGIGPELAGHLLPPFAPPQRLNNPFHPRQLQLMLATREMNDKVAFLVLVKKRIEQTPRDNPAP